MKKITISAFLVLLFCSQIFGQEVPESWAFVAKGGLSMSGPGDINIGGYKAKPKVSPMLKADFDGILIEKLSMGLFFIYASMGIENYSKSSNVMTIGGTIKPRFALSDDIQIRPAIAFGYQYIKNEDMTDNSNGFDVGGQLEIAKYLANGGAIVGELGFISQPVGGDGTIDITFPPILYISIGYEFGK